MVESQNSMSGVSPMNIHKAATVIGGFQKFSRVN